MVGLATIDQRLPFQLSIKGCAPPLPPTAMHAEGLVHDTLAK